MRESLKWIEEVARRVRPEDLPRTLAALLKSGLSPDQELEAIDQACDQLEAHFAPHCLALLAEGISLAQQFSKVDRERLFRQRLGILYRATRAAPAPSLSFSADDLIDGRLRVYCGLQGGMGEVFFCKDEWHGTFCVVKLPRSSRLNDYFIDECTAWLLVSGHQNIATALYSGNLDTRPYLVIDYVAGLVPGHSDLRALLRLRRVVLNEAIDFCVQFCDGMTWAQGVVPGIVHRDIKPENILLDFSGTLKIADWGLTAGKLPDESVGVMSVGDERIELPPFPRKSYALDAKVGTAQYKSPEQCGGKPVSVASDIYSFGCVAYEMLAGRPPFLHQQQADYVEAHLREIPRALEDVAPHVPHALSLIVQKCLDKRPARRFATFAEVRAALMELPTQARPELETRRAARLMYAGQESYSQRVERCIGLSKVGKHQVALRMIEAVVKDHPEEAYGWFTKGNILNELTLHQDGLAALRRALELDPESPSILFNLGVRERMHGDKGAGEQHLKRAAELGHEKASQFLASMKDGKIILIT